MKRATVGAVLLLVVLLSIIVFLFFARYGKRIQVQQNIKDKKLTVNKSIPDNLNLESIFRDDHSWTATLSAEKVIKILVTGDILPARSVNAGVAARKNPLWPYEKVSGKINSLNTDLTFVNLETPLLKNCPVTHSGMIFCGDSSNIEGLKAIGTDLASLANNHTGNYGVSGLNETVENIRNAGIIPVGIKGPVYRKVKGVTFAFLAFNDIEKFDYGFDLAQEELIAKYIKDAKLNSDVVVVMYHWGTEYQAQPDERQVYLAHFTVDKGADLVVSNHPHWIQPLEFYKGKVIMYAHGNFIFDQMWSEETKTGVLGLYTFYEKQLIDVEFFPLKIYDYGQAVFLEDLEREKILAKLKNESIKLQKSYFQSGR